MSNSPVIKNETSPLSSEDSTLVIHEKTQLDLMLKMLTEMKVGQDRMQVSQDRMELRLTRLEEKKSSIKSPRDKVSSSLFVDVVNTEWD